MFLKTPQASLVYTFDWSDALPAGVLILSVSHTVPAGLTKISDSTDVDGKMSSVDVGGGTHGGLYVVNALALLNNGESVPDSFTVRVFA